MSFALDDWIPPLGHLKNYIVDKRAILRHATVSNFVDSNGLWDWSLLKDYFLKGILSYIAACLVPNEALGNDCCLWKLNKNGHFSVKLAYSSLTTGLSMSTLESWDLIWKSWLSSCIKHFLWLVQQNRVLSNVERARRGMTDDASYELNGGTQETVLHIVRDCTIALAV